jgi:hypothetical protein
MNTYNKSKSITIYDIIESYNNFGNETFIIDLKSYRIPERLQSNPNGGTPIKYFNIQFKPYKVDKEINTNNVYINFYLKYMFLRSRGVNDQTKQPPNDVKLAFILNNEEDKDYIKALNIFQECITYHIENLKEKGNFVFQKKSQKVFDDQKNNVFKFNSEDLRFPLQMNFINDKDGSLTEFTNPIFWTYIRCDLRNKTTMKDLFYEDYDGESKPFIKKDFYVNFKDNNKTSQLCMKTFRNKIKTKYGADDGELLDYTVDDLIAKYPNSDLLWKEITRKTKLIPATDSQGKKYTNVNIHELITRNTRIAGTVQFQLTCSKEFLNFKAYITKEAILNYPDEIEESLDDFDESEQDFIFNYNSKKIINENKQQEKDNEEDIEEEEEISDDEIDRL